MTFKKTQKYLRYQQLYIFIIIFCYFHNSLFADQTIADTLGYKILDIKKGDRCIVCNMKLEEGKGLALLISGKRVTVDLDHLEEFLANPSKYFTKLQPNVALYSKEAAQALHVGYGWFIFGVWVAFALIVAAICANIALRKGLPAYKWFFVGLITNVFGLFIITFKSATGKIDLPRGYKKIEITESPVACSKCGSYNHPSAKKCNSCGNIMIAITDSELDRI